MAACIPYVQWLSANAACRAKSAGIDVKGFGYVRTGVAGLRGLGDFAATFNLAPTSAPPVVQGTVIAPVISQPTLNTTPVYNDPNDPCFVASQTPCPMASGCPAGCPTGYHSVNLLVAPGKPAQCMCAKDKATSPSSGSATAPPSGNQPGDIVPTTDASIASGGFSHWGLLAAVAGVGLVGYLVMKKKAA